MLFREDFDDNRENWLVGNRARTNAYLNNGSFYLEGKRAGYNYSRRTEQGYIRDNQDYEIRLKVELVKDVTGRGFGLEWGGNSLDNSFYEFWIRGDQMYSIDRFDDATRSFYDYVSWTPSKAINPKGFNQLIVRKERDTLFFFINQELVHTMKPVPLKGAEVGFIVPPLGTVAVDMIELSLLNGSQKPILKIDATPSIYALMVAVADYEDEHISDLSFTVNDAQAMAKFYQSENGGGVSKENLTLLLNYEATKKNILYHLKRMLFQAKVNDLVIFYFAGHGDLMFEADQSTFQLIPADYKNKLEDTSISIKEVQDLFKASQASKKLMILDACHSGGSLPELKGRKLMEHMAQLVDTEIAILTSSEIGETSIEASTIGEGRGLFSYQLINGLVYQSRKCDTNKNGIISILELFNYVNVSVAETAKVKFYHEQNPQIGGKFNIQLPLAEVTRGE